MSREAPPTPAWLAPDRLVPDLLAGLWVLLIVMLYADGPLRFALETARRIVDR